MYVSAILFKEHFFNPILVVSLDQFEIV